MKHLILGGGLFFTLTSQSVMANCVSTYQLDGKLNIPCVNVPGLGAYNVDMQKTSSTEFVFALTGATPTTINTTNSPSSPITIASLKLYGSAYLRSPSGNFISVSCSVDTNQGKLVCPFISEYAEAGEWAIEQFYFYSGSNAIDSRSYSLNSQTGKYQYYDYTQRNYVDTSINKVSFNIPASSQTDNVAPTLTSIENPQAFVTNGYAVVIQASDNASGVKSASMGFSEPSSNSSSSSTCGSLGAGKFLCKADSWLLSQYAGKTVRVYFSTSDYAGNSKNYGYLANDTVYQGTQTPVIQVTLPSTVAAGLATPNLTLLPELKAVTPLKTTVASGEPAMFLVTANTQNGIWGSLYGYAYANGGTTSQSFSCNGVSMTQFLCSGTLAATTPGEWFIKEFNFSNQASSTSRRFTAESPTSNYLYRDSSSNASVQTSVPAVRLMATTAIASNATPKVNVINVRVENTIATNRLAIVYIDLSAQ